ncbi:MAG: PLP-dependent lyase/thiolase [Candidatus Dormibacteria bacterium]
MPAPAAEPATGPGQWVHLPLFGLSVAPSSRLTLGEAETPLEPAPQLGAELGIPGLWLKREDLSPTGSHKARAMGLLCSLLREQGHSQAVISSSGNAALAAAAFCRQGGLSLLCLLSPRTPRAKLEAVLAEGATVVLSERPVALLRHAVRAWGLSDLRTSTNPEGPTAYRGIAAELLRQGLPPAGVFLYSSSGATALGVLEGFQRLLPESGRPQVHPVEMEPGGEITRPWYPPPAPSPGLRAWEPAGELGTRRSRLAPRLRREARASGGRGWRVGSAGLEWARRAADRHRLETSWEGLAALGAMSQASLPGPGPWVAVLSGAAWQLDLAAAEDPRSLAALAGSEEELDRVLEGAGFLRQAP